MIVAFLHVGNQPHVVPMVASVKRVLKCELVQMSDLQTPMVLGVDRVERIPFRVPLMLYRFKHLVALDHDELLILDTDVIVKKTVWDVFVDEWDVALTKRPPEESFSMPYNTGVMFSRSKAFWVDCLDWLRDQPEDDQRWYGDQKAVAEVVSRGTYNVKELPCEKFNWTPNSKDETSDARIWHYKGAIRKRWM